MEKSFDEATAMSVSRKSIILNTILFVFKLYAGIFSHSGALISDAVHTASDVFSTFIVMAGVKQAAKAADKEHSYGHERFEPMAAILLSISLAVVGVLIGKSGIMKIIDGSYRTGFTPGIVALIAAIVSIAVKEIMFIYTKKAAEEIHSEALLADSYHHHSDALSSIGSLVGVVGARLGAPVLDPIASLVICVFIIKVAVEIFIDSSKELIDESCDEETEGKIRDAVLSVDGVRSIDLLKTRKFGTKIYVDIEIGADGNLTLNEAHSIAENVHNSVEKSSSDIKHCMVHVNPV
ncbi:MAG: cation transporter [Firmicutes bacterium]|nr:cation transporter [Bacillota bacterium]MBQ7241871.1 cation transporter [Bacillota bacterium]MBR0104362.1 cation transporter [Bacillota bacterium]MBR2594009.1 cation transporter [Bacillota bacterium]